VEKRWNFSRTTLRENAPIAAIASLILLWILAVPHTASMQSNVSVLLKDRVAIEMKKYFGRDFKRIGHASKVARYAERIAREERANLAVVLAAAYLHDIGIKEAERKHQSTAAKYQEEEGPPIAREILTKLGAKEELIDEVCDIVGHHHHPRDEETVNFMALYDADMLVNLEEKQEEEEKKPSEALERVIEKAFLTESGKNLARQVLLRRKS